MDSIQKIYDKYREFIQYFTFSVIATLVDVTTVWILFHSFSIGLGFSNTIGVTLGFILNFFLSVKFVFQTRYGVLSFLIYLVTFLIGLVVADFAIVQSYAFAIQWVSKELAFLFGKGVSLVLPFFFIYFIRKKLYACLNQRNQSEE